jgi:recombination protein RecR
MFEEIIFATDPTSDGEFTAQYIKERASEYCKKISRIAIGMPIGSEVDYIDQNTLTKAFLDRRKM